MIVVDTMNLGYLLLNHENAIDAPSGRAVFSPQVLARPAHRVVSFRGNASIRTLANRNDECNNLPPVGNA